MELKEGTSVWEEVDCRHYKKLPNMPYDYHSYAFQNFFFFSFFFLYRSWWHLFATIGIKCLINEHFKLKIRGENPATIFFLETHIPSTILAMSEVIYPPALYSNHFPHSSVLKGKPIVRHTYINLCNYFLCLFYVVEWWETFYGSVFHYLWGLLSPL